MVIEHNMSQWQWLYGGVWSDCSPDNNKTLRERYLMPTLECITLTNDYGVLWGVPETHNMLFRMHDDIDEVQTKIRRGPKPGECILFQIKDGPITRIIPPLASAQLFTDGKASSSRQEVMVGTEIFMAENGILSQKMNGEWVRRRFDDSGLSHDQFEDLTRSRYSWEFKGPFRWERMQLSVKKTCAEISSDHADFLLQTFSDFSPTDDVTEYGPYQFDDYLTSIGEVGLAIKLMENYHSIELERWRPCSASTTARIERSRSEDNSAELIRVHGQTYMIIFDSGAGASGAGPAVVRPMRYQKILESIEEQYQGNDRRETMSNLFDLLIANDINPRVFLTATISQPGTWQEMVPESVRTEIITMTAHLHGDGPSNNLSTRLQQFMPTLLQKFQECEMRLSVHEHAPVKKLCASVCKTLKTGMCVPASVTATWKELIYFIVRQHSWNCEGPQSICDICSERKVCLSHCGNNRACLRCWSSTLVKTCFTCPFCRGGVGTDMLKTANCAPCVRNTGKRKRVAHEEVATTKSASELLKVIHKSELYKNVSEKTSFSLQKWFIILLRQKLVNIHQRPKDDQASKSFIDAMKIFKLCN